MKGDMATQPLVALPPLFSARSAEPHSLPKATKPASASGFRSPRWLGLASSFPGHCWARHSQPSCLCTLGPFQPSPHDSRPLPTSRRPSCFVCLLPYAPHGWTSLFCYCCLTPQQAREGRIAALFSFLSPGPGTGWAANKNLLNEFMAQRPVSP